jgi:tRNA nucleotidyltransferase (CCA-adding enzyme)
MKDLELVETIAKDIAVHGGRTYFIGGFARDNVLQSLGHTVESKDIDLEVYGVGLETLKQILSAHGPVNLVGASFGVIKLGNTIDIALPRTDSKSGIGHKAFMVDVDENMTVREAARRRDFTVNTIAIDVLTGEIIDPFGGVDDLKHGVLRVTDPELFKEDSLRVLRAMQLAARFNLKPTPETIEVCRSIDLDDLPSERIGEEWKKLLLKADRPSIGLYIARELGILQQLHPELEILDTIPQNPEWHAEGSVWEHTKMAVDVAARIIRRDELPEAAALEVMLAVLCHDIGKATTTETQDGKIISPGHAKAGGPLTSNFLRQLKLGNSYLETVPRLVTEHMVLHTNPNLADTALRRLAIRLYPATLAQLLRVDEADILGRASEHSDTGYLQKIATRADRLDITEDKPQPLIRGRDLMTLGVQPGITMGAMLTQLFEAQLAGQFSTASEGLMHAKELIRAQQ